MKDSEEVRKLKGQLAERDALLRRSVEFTHDLLSPTRLRRDIENALSASAEPSAPKRETCKSCHGEGVIHTGVEESPTTLCNRCDGSGNEPSAPVERDERAEFNSWFKDHSKDWPLPSESIKCIARNNDWIVWQARAALERKP